MQDKPYNYRQCQSLFGYAAKVHERSGGKCQLCGCGGDSDDFDLWRQMTVEHLIGKSQDGYLNQIRSTVEIAFPDLLPAERSALAEQLDTLNTVTACSFCNSTTSRDASAVSMRELILSSSGNPAALLETASQVLEKVLARKQEQVRWKLEAVRAAYDAVRRA